MQKDKILTVISGLIIIVTVFILSQSFLSQENSVKESETVQSAVTNVFETQNKLITNLTKFRKVAHFAEYAVLGICASLFVIRKHKKVGMTEVYQLLSFCLIIGVADEIIQYFSGRTALVEDIMLDFFGALCSVAAVFLVRFIIKKLSYIRGK